MNAMRVPLRPLLVLCAALAAVMFVDLPGGRRWLEVLQDAGHVPAFALITACLLRLQPGAMTALRLARAVAAALLLGATVEVIQFTIGRDASWADIGRDACGALAAAAWLLWRDAPAARRRARRLALLSLCAALLIGFWPLIECARAYRHRQERFPLIADFSSPLDLYFLRPVYPPFERGCLPGAMAGTSCRRWAVYAAYTPATWAGPVFEELLPDWRGRHALCIEVSNPNAAAFTLVVALQDRAYSGQRSDRYTGLWPVAAQATRRLCLPLAGIRITPGGRALDLAHIARLAIAQDDTGHQAGFRLHRVWLQ
ncbi:MAG: VanZ family protein [Gammaproteobacteria bacterium]|nr:VanZ family protein [Gammaproteobacteria bacterium]